MDPLLHMFCTSKASPCWHTGADLGSGLQQIRRLWRKGWHGGIARRARTRRRSWRRVVVVQRGRSVLHRPDRWPGRDPSGGGVGAQGNRDHDRHDCGVARPGIRRHAVQRYWRPARTRAVHAVVGEPAIAVVMGWWVARVKHARSMSCRDGDRKTGWASFCRVPAWCMECRGWGYWCRGRRSRVEGRHIRCRDCGGIVAGLRVCANGLASETRGKGVQGAAHVR